MSEQISNLPERIYLVFEYAEPGDDFRDFPEVSWCSDRISDSDVEYVRATRITELEQQLAEARRENERLRAHIQEAADDAETDCLISAWRGVRDWHLSALTSKAGESNER